MKTPPFFLPLPSIFQDVPGKVQNPIIKQSSPVNRESAIIKYLRVKEYPSIP
jgi:hypothetical protein